jgi:LacI family gluconate utilization system Gnt-I transcriptional repressor
LTTVRLPQPQIGARAAELLLDRIAGKPDEGSVVDMGFEIIARSSTRKAR